MWEKIQDRDFDDKKIYGGVSVFSSRLKVPMGWIIRTLVISDGGVDCEQTFVHDHIGSWKLK